MANVLRTCSGINAKSLSGVSVKFGQDHCEVKFISVGCGEARSASFEKITHEPTMTDCRRFRHPGVAWFFTVNLAERRGNRLLVDQINILREAFVHVKKNHPFVIEAIVVLPEHVHCILSLPMGDSGFSTRWGLIKARFFRDIEKDERISKSRNKRGERGLWQRRFWEHLIRDETDYQQHVDYIHWNPVRHGWVRNVKDWPHSSFLEYVKRGVYPDNWGGGVKLSDVVAGE